MSFYLGDPKVTLVDLLAKVQHCTTVPAKGPGRNVKSSSAPWKKAGVLLIYPARAKELGISSADRPLFFLSH